MTDKEEGSSFNNPKPYQKYLEHGVEALAKYQYFRRPVGFHVGVLIALVLLVTFTFPIMIFILPILGLVYSMRTLEDGFNPEPKEGEPVFTLAESYAIPSAGMDLGIYFRTIFGELKYLWFWKPWKFYVFAFYAPLLGTLGLYRNGFLLCRDKSCLIHWDKWLAKLDDGEDDTEHIRGAEIHQLPESSGSSPVAQDDDSTEEAKSQESTPEPIKKNVLRRIRGEVNSIPKALKEMHDKAKEAAQKK